MKIFISYSSKDLQIITNICECLKKTGFIYWAAHENGNFGEHYAATIVNKIAESDIFLVFVSKASNLSTHVINELNSAVMRDKIIIPVILDDVKLSPALEYYLSSNHYLQYTSDESFLNRLISRINGIMGREAELSEKQKQENISTEYEDLLTRANNGDIDAMCEVGRKFYLGDKGFEKDLKMAFAYFKRSAEGGNPAAQCNVGWCYEVGDGVEQDISSAFEWYLKSAENNCSMAQYSLGWMYSNGVFVAKNASKAVGWFIKAAENGHAMAQYKLALAYLDGTGVDQNVIIANHWLMLAADQGIVFAQYKLAENYYHGIGCKQDIIKAKQMWLLSAEKGFDKSAAALEKYYDIYYMDQNKSFLA